MLRRFFASSQHRFTHFFAWPFMPQDHEGIVSASRLSVAFSPSRNPGFEHISEIVYKILSYLTFSLNTTQINMVKELCRFSQINVFMVIFRVGLMFYFLSASYMSSTYTDKNSPFFSVNDKHSHFGTFSQPYFGGIFSNCRSIISPAKGRPYRFPF